MHDRYHIKYIKDSILINVSGLGLKISKIDCVCYSSYNLNYVKYIKYIVTSYISRYSNRRVVDSLAIDICCTSKI